MTQPVHMRRPYLDAVCEVWGVACSSYAPDWAVQLAEHLYCDSNEWDGMGTGELERTLAWVASDPHSRRRQLRTVMHLAHKDTEPRSLRLSMRREAVRNLVEAA